MVYEPGDRVWVRHLEKDKSTDSKLDPLYTGPCEVLERVGTTGRYVVGLPHGTESVHMERLKPYLSALNGDKLKLLFFKPEPKLPVDDTIVVEKILKHRIVNGRHQWRVRWKGLDPSEDSWEDATAFIGEIQRDWVKFNRDNKINFRIESLPDFH